MPFATKLGRMTESVRQHDLASLAERFGLTLRGDGRTLIRGVGTLARADGSQLAFLANSRYTAQLATTQAGAVVLAADQAEASPVPVLIAADPYVAYAKIATLFQHQAATRPGIHPGAVVAPDAEISATASIGPLCVIEEGARIGDGAVLGPH